LRFVAIGMTGAAAELASPFAAKDSPSVLAADDPVSRVALVRGSILVPLGAYANAPAATRC
jgi:hypothetical protein